MKALLKNILAIWFAAFISLPSAADPPTPPDKEAPGDRSAGIEVLITQLGHTDYRKRTAATQQLRAMGRMVIPYMRKALDHDDLEIRIRAREIIASLQWKIEGVLAKRIGTDLEKFPDLPIMQRRKSIGRFRKGKGLAAPYLARIAGTDPDLIVRTAAVRDLFKIAATKSMAGETLRALGAADDFYSKMARAGALLALGRVTESIDLYTEAFQGADNDEKKRYLVYHWNNALNKSKNPRRGIAALQNQLEITLPPPGRPLPHDDPAALFRIKAMLEALIKASQRLHDTDTRMYAVITALRVDPRRLADAVGLGADLYKRKSFDQLARLLKAVPGGARPELEILYLRYFLDRHHGKVAANRLTFIHNYRRREIKARYDAGQFLEGVSEYALAEVEYRLCMESPAKSTYKTKAQARLKELNKRREE